MLQTTVDSEFGGRPVDAGEALNSAQAEDRKYYRHRMALLHSVRTRTGWTLGLLYGALLLGCYLAFGMYANAQEDHRVRGLLGLLMYFLGFAAVPITLGFANLYERVWTYHARKLGLDPDDLTKVD